jgi:membrane-bound lytic murein transglycosylase B
MANKQNFNPDEWSKILQSTMLAGIAITAAEPSGLWGALKEAFASSSALAAAKSNTSSSELIKAVVADFETKEGRASIQDALRQHLAGAKPADAVQRSLANLRDVSAILDAKAPQDAAGFKTWLRAISQNVADASSEGGFLGIGGVKVSEAEKATLAEISKALGTSA